MKLMITWFIIFLAFSPVFGGILDRLKCKISEDTCRRPGSQATETVATGPLNPIIILPGDGGSQLQASLDKKSVKNRICPSKTNGFMNVWADLDMLIPALVDCWVDNLKLVYNKITRKTEDADGVTIRVPGFGDTNTIEYLTKTKFPSSRYFADMVDMLVDHGYQRGVSVRGAPYDFRKSQNENPQFFQDLQKLVEDTYHLNNQSKIVFIAHSLGNLYLLYFLNRQPDAWKTTYVSSFISMGGPWAGAIKPLKTIATGDDLGIPIVSRSKIMDVVRTNPSVAELLPSDKYWERNATLIMTPEKKYTLNNIKEFFDDLNYSEGYDFYMDTKNLTYSLTAPGVKVYCVSGTGVSTPAMYIYKEGGFPKSNPIAIMEDGDGSVNRRSLDACGDLQKGQTLPVVSKVFQGAGHKEMTKNQAVLAYIREILFP